MLYSELVQVYESLSATTKRLEKTSILSEFLKKLSKNPNKESIYLILGRIVPDYDSRELGISEQLAIKVISISFGIPSEKVSDRFKKTGDLGEIAKEFSEKKRQSSLFTSKLTVEKVIENLKKLMEIEGKGAVDKKLSFISELLSSASPLEAKYIVRTILSDLKIGVNSPTIVDSLAKAFDIDSEKNTRIL